MPARKKHNSESARKGSGGIASSGAAGAAAEPGAAAPDLSLAQRGRDLTNRHLNEIGASDLASPAWLHVLAQERGGPDPDVLVQSRPRRVALLSDLLWFLMASELAVYRKPGDKGPDVGVRATSWRLLGARVARRASHLDCTDVELLRGAYTSVTAEDGELRRIVGVELVARGRECSQGAAAADEDTFEAGRVLDEETRGARPPAARRKRGRGFQEAVEGTLWVVAMLQRLGGAHESLPKEAWMVRPGDFCQDAYLKALMAGRTDADAREAASADGAESAAFWGPLARGER